MRVCVFVDGENLRYAIGDLFAEQQSSSTLAIQLSRGRLPLP